MILPQPSDAFEWIEAPAGLALVCRPLEPFARHLFTTPVCRLGVPAFGSGLRWADVARAMDVESDRLLRVHQVHGANAVVQRIGQPVSGPADADIIVCDDPSVAMAVQTADCVPLLIADRCTGVVAAAHAGWRGLADRVPHVTVEAMEEEFGSRASTLVAVIGPSIGACCYQVGSDVRDRFAAAGFSDWDMARWFSREACALPNNPSLAVVNRVGRDGHWFLDMWATARDQLRAAGVREDRIFVADLCTASHPDVFCSYRRDGSRAGRMAAAIRKPENARGDRDPRRTGPGEL